MKTESTLLKNREGDTLVKVSPKAGHHVTDIGQIIESCYRSDGFDKLLWNWRFFTLLSELEGVTPYSYNLDTGEVMQ